MSFIIKSICPVTGEPKGFRYNNRPYSQLGVNELRGALCEVLRANVMLRNEKRLDIILTKQRLTGLDAEVKGIRFNKLMQELKS